jgi:hypothetical protein
MESFMLFLVDLASAHVGTIHSHGQRRGPTIHRILTHIAHTQPLTHPSRWVLSPLISHMAPRPTRYLRSAFVEESYWKQPHDYSLRWRKRSRSGLVTRVEKWLSFCSPEAFFQLKRSAALTSCWTAEAFCRPRHKFFLLTLQFAIRSPHESAYSFLLMSLTSIDHCLAPARNTGSAFFFYVIRLSAKPRKK